MPTRCDWVPPDDPLYVAYHDEEWGVPSRDDRHLFEMLVLEGAQAGLSWSTILHKREGYRRAFAGFDARARGAVRRRDVERLMDDAGIVRNRLKIESAIANAAAIARGARRAREPRGVPVGLRRRRADRQHGGATIGEVPAETAESKAMSRT